MYTPTLPLARKNRPDLDTFLHRDLSEWKAINGQTPPAVVPVGKLTIDKPSVTLAKGDSATLKAIVEPANATNKGVTWSSSAPSIARVSDGRVKAVAAGVATISAQTVDGGLTATCRITVTDNTSGNTEALTPQVYAVPRGVRIILPQPETVYIFSLNGLGIRALPLRVGEHVESLAPGVYVVRIREQSYKVLVRDK